MVTWLALSNSFWNPFLYWLLNNQFRQVSKELLLSKVRVTVNGTVVQQVLCAAGVVSLRVSEWQAGDCGERYWFVGYNDWLGATCGVHTGVGGDAVRWGTELQAGRSWVRFPKLSLEFFIDITLTAELWPWGWLGFYHKWVPGRFPGGKGGRCLGLTTLPPWCADWLEICEPQPPVTLRACPGL